jgi:uncharacterized DUF497 family protein
MEFEWDPEKSEENRRKHGISFLLALEIWQGRTLSAPDIAKSSDSESRGATIGIVGGVLFTAIWAIWTLRNNRIRMISVRRSRDGEKEAYKNKAL